MSKDEYKSMGDDEYYQYPEDEHVVEADAASANSEQADTAAEPTEQDEAPADSKWQRFAFIGNFVRNNKRVSFVIAAILVVLLLFKVMGGGRHVDSSQTDAHRQAQQHIAAQHNQQQADLAAKTYARPSVATTSQLDSLKADTKEANEATTKLQNQIQDMQSQVSQTASQQAALNKSMLALVQEVKHLSDKLQAEHTAPAAKKATKSAPVRHISFHLRAIVPGRAWIVSSDGLSQSVSVGDSVPQYGRVKVVDANRGMVLTSSGKVIDYGINDK